ncbi:MAG: HEAT repeat domain-containing protein [Phycisphaerae bacterium]
MQQTRWICILAVSIGVFLPAACRDGGGLQTLEQRLQHEDPHVRKEALVQAVEKNRTQALPYMVAALSDQDRVVRMTAILGLEKMTGQTLGYKYYQSWDQRQQGVEKWKRWLVERNLQPLQPDRDDPVDNGSRPQTAQNPSAPD